MRDFYLCVLTFAILVSHSSPPGEPDLFHGAIYYNFTWVPPEDINKVPNAHMMLTPDSNPSCRSRTNRSWS